MNTPPLSSENVAVVILVALLTGGFLTSLVQGFLQRKKLGADYADVIAKSATGLLQPLHERVQELEADLKREKQVARQLSEELAEARAVVRLLRTELLKAREEHAENRRQQGGGS